MPKAILIDAAKREIREIDNDGLKTLQAAVGGYIETAYAWENGDVLFVDEEGMFKPQADFFRVPMRSDQPLAGNGVVVGKERYDGEGEYLGTEDPAITVAELRELVEFRDRAQVDAWAKANASDVASAVTFVSAGTVETTVTGRVGALFADMPRPEPANDQNVETLIGRIVEEDDYKTLKMIADRLGNGMKLSPDQRRDLSNIMHVVLGRAFAVTAKGQG
jgi:uncharacterized protein DUF3846